jgi:hypothetical protein
MEVSDNTVVKVMARREQTRSSKGGFGWLVAGLLLLTLFITYLDRQTFSVLVPLLPPTDTLLAHM